MPVVLLAVWIALAASVLAVFGSAALAVSRAFRAWRTFRRASRHVTGGLGDVTAKAVATEAKAVAATANSAKLAEAVANLQESLAVLAVLRAALSEATAPVANVRSAMPRK
jgi:hypothetical protein